MMKSFVLGDGKCVNSVGQNKLSVTREYDRLCDFCCIYNSHAHI